MTRAEQIQEAAPRYIGFQFRENEIKRKAFIRGARWADEHPADRWVRVEDAPFMAKFLGWGPTFPDGPLRLHDVGMDDCYEDASGVLIAKDIVTHVQPLPEAPK